MTAVAISKVSSLGEFTIPDEIRKALNILGGTELFVMTDGENIILKPVSEDRVSHFERLSSVSRSFAESAGLDQSSVADLIKEVRGE